MSNSRESKCKKIEHEIGWLNKLVFGLRSLRESEFDYSEYVSETKNECGTVCCAFGWMPKFVPESGVKWEETYIINNLKTSINKCPVQTFGGISRLKLKTSVSINRIGIKIVEFMFNGVIDDFLLSKLDEIYTNHRLGVSGMSAEDKFGKSNIHEVSKIQAIRRIEASILFIEMAIKTIREKKMYTAISYFSV